MKKIFILISMSILSNASFSQIEKGVKLIMGTGSIHSSNLNKMLESRKANDQYLIRSNSHSRNGINIGLGYFINYNLNNRISLSTDISLNILSTHLYVNYYRDSANLNKGISHRITSESKINFAYLNIPIMVRYGINKRNNLFLTGGLSLQIMSNPHIHSKELSVINYYDSNVIDSTFIVREKSKDVLNKHNKLQVNFILGIEKRFNNRMKNFSLSLIYQMPITRGELYSTNGTLSRSMNNYLLSDEGKREAEESDPRHKLKDFRSSSISFVVKYYIKKRNKKN